MTAPTADTLAPVSAPERPENAGPLWDRMEAAGLNVSRLARLSASSRGTVYDVLNEVETVTKKKRAAVLGAIERAEAGDAEPQPGMLQPATDGSMIEFEVNIDALGVHVLVHGDVANADEVREQAVKLIEDMRASSVRAKGPGSS